jgi:hypothetical protein
MEYRSYKLSLSLSLSRSGDNLPESIARLKLGHDVCVNVKLLEVFFRGGAITLPLLRDDDALPPCLICRCAVFVGGRRTGRGGKGVHRAGARQIFQVLHPDVSYVSAREGGSRALF